MTIVISTEISVIFQGDRTQNVGIVDSEYVVHNAIQTLGGSSHDHKAKVFTSFLYKCFELFASY